MKSKLEFLKFSDKPDESLLRAVQIVRKTKDLQQLRQAQTFLLTYVHGMTVNEAAMLLGISTNWVYKLRQDFMKGNLVSCKDPSTLGGRRRENMTLAQEIKFMSSYFQAAKNGESIKASDIKKALEIYLGRNVALSSVYNLLKRHNLSIRSLQTAPEITR